MKLFGHTVARMYISAIVLLVFLAGASAYLLGEFPYALIVAVLACAAIELVIQRYYLKHKARIPFSGIITGLIIGCVAPINVPLVPVFIACAIAIASKFFIKLKSSNVFNPAALGLLALGLMLIGSSWWATTSINIYGVAVSLSIVLVIAAYECRRLPLAFAFIITSVVLSIVASPPLVLGNVAIALLSVNYFFAFLMITEPKTSPPRSMGQTVYGIYIAVIYFALITLLPHSLYFGLLIIFASLLLGNLTYALYRKLGGITGISGSLPLKEVEPKPA
jgi:glycine betaine catabolism B